MKHSVGQDLIVAEVAGDDPGARARLLALPGIDDVSVEKGRITVSTSDGPATLSPIALSLGESGLEVKSLTLRTPTLDDVFAELTGSHIEAVGR